MGLVVYGWKYFLLVIYIGRWRDVIDSMLNLSDCGFLVFVVDSSKVILISFIIEL